MRKFKRSTTADMMKSITIKGHHYTFEYNTYNNNWTEMKRYEDGVFCDYEQHAGKYSIMTWCYIHGYSMLDLLFARV